MQSNEAHYHQRGRRDFDHFGTRRETYNYVCKDHGKSLSQKVDDTQNTLEWKGTTYKINENEDCAKFGWRAEKDGTSFDFCKATKSYADIEQNGIEIPCDLKLR